MAIDPGSGVGAPAPASSDGPVTDTGKIAKWALGLGTTWVVLTLGVDIGATRDLAVAFAVLILGAVILIHGEDAVRNLGFIK